MTQSGFSYEKDPTAIYRQSFNTVRSEARLDELPLPLHPLAIRLIHACGMTDIPQDMAFSDDIQQAAFSALANGAKILTDVEMTAHGIIRRYLPCENEVICTLNDPAVPELAKRIGNTRSAAAVELWEPHLKGAVAVFGNAPTALFHLLDLIAQGFPKPAAILGFPVGFVGAAESKEALVQSTLGIPFVTLLGRRGGSAIAAAAVNAMAAGLPEENTYGEKSA
ncbi:precorrin-8X methylmutase [Flexibacterium corallicola]|uniref:precorrin-8X methylmutase n=1 Tax=Flexibacterium corallicola TaxID=3037259 RepID=UPI00286F0BC5|nr:precorrin-8X methylmutase [Pseudovibrio sp. M1P-2-3]